MADKITKNFDVQLTDLDGKPLQEPAFDSKGQPTGQMEDTAPMNKLIARALQTWSTKEGDDPVKLFDWALTINKGGDIDLERDDYTKIKEIIKKSYTQVLVQAQIIKLLDA